MTLRHEAFPSLRTAAGRDAPTPRSWPRSRRRPLAATDPNDLTVATLRQQVGAARVRPGPGPDLRHAGRGAGPGHRPGPGRLRRVRGRRARKSSSPWYVPFSPEALAQFRVAAAGLGAGQRRAVDGRLAPDALRAPGGRRGDGHRRARRGVPGGAPGAVGQQVHAAPRPRRHEHELAPGRRLPRAATCGRSTSGWPSRPAAPTPPGSTSSRVASTRSSPPAPTAPSSTGRYPPRWSPRRPAVPTRSCSPEFSPGDALLFDHLFLHRTGVAPGMTRERWAIETWFFAPSTLPRGPDPARLSERSEPVTASSTRPSQSRHVILSFVYPSSHHRTGGVIVLYELANACARRGHEVHFVHGPLTPYRIRQPRRAAAVPLRGPASSTTSSTRWTTRGCRPATWSSSGRRRRRLGLPVEIVQGFRMLHGGGRASTCFRAAVPKACVASWLVDVGLRYGVARRAALVRAAGDRPPHVRGPHAAGPSAATTSPCCRTPTGRRASPWAWRRWPS